MININWKQTPCKVKDLKKNRDLHSISKTLNDCDTRIFLSEFQRYFVTVTIDNASYNLLFNFKSFL